jgi:hypothetical protein
MVENKAVTGEIPTAQRLVELLEQDGFRIDAAVWAVEGEGRGRLYLVPHDRKESVLKQTIRIAAAISEHKDELPDRHELLYSVVDPAHPIIQAVQSVSVSAGKINGIFKNGTYIDAAYVLRTAA